MTAKPVLILGSAPSVLAAQSWPKSQFSAIVAINNAWQVRDDWDYHIAPDDFPAERGPQALRTGQKRITSADYVPANNSFGGILYAGGTMAFTTGYWALAALTPAAMVFAGCDMVYPSGSNTHFYGQGTADPLRKDITLRNLEAKSARLMLHAANQGCTCLRASTGESRLVFPSVTAQELARPRKIKIGSNKAQFDEIKTRETALGYFVPSGRYWQSQKPVCTAKLDALDAAWLGAVVT